MTKYSSLRYSEQLGFHYGSFTLVSNQANGVVGYTEQGRLLYRPPTQGSPAALLTPQAFAGAQYFNDRRQGGYPFDPARQDRLGLTINAQTGEVTLQLLSWGGSLMNVTPQCENGVMYGFGNTPGIKRLFVISLGKGIYHP